MEGMLERIANGMTRNATVNAAAGGDSTTDGSLDVVGLFDDG